jgi:hypothetical protein
MQLSLGGFMAQPYVEGRAHQHLFSSLARARQDPYYQSLVAEDF